MLTVIPHFISSFIVLTSGWLGALLEAYIMDYTRDEKQQLAQLEGTGARGWPFKAKLPNANDHPEFESGTTGAGGTLQVVFVL